MLRRSLFAFCFLVLPAVQGCRTDSSRSDKTISSGTPFSEKGATPELGLGKAVSLPAYRVRFVSQRLCSSTEPNIPRNGNLLWAAEIELTNLSPDPVAVSPFYTSLKDAQNYTYVTSLVGCLPVLEAKHLAPGEQTRGYVPFELPQSIRLGTLTYRPVLPGNAEQVARFAVEF